MTYFGLLWDTNNIPGPITVNGLLTVTSLVVTGAATDKVNLGGSLGGVVGGPKDGILTIASVDPTASSTGNVAIARWSNTTYGGFLGLLRSRGTVIGTLVALQSGDQISSIFSGGVNSNSLWGQATGFNTYAALVTANYIAGDYEFTSYNKAGVYGRKLYLDSEGVLYLSIASSKPANPANGAIMFDGSSIRVRIKGQWQSIVTVPAPQN